MDETPAVRVRSTRLDDGQPVALRDSMTVYDLAIDFSQPPADIVGALHAIFRDSIDSGRWVRRRTNNTEPTTPPVT